MQTALQRILISDTDATASQDAEQWLGDLWISMQTNPDILTLLAQPDQLLAALVNTESLSQTALNLGSIQIILEQGLMAYLGDIRLDKQHPERHALYEQRDAVVAEMLAFALWFYQDILKIELEQQTHQLQQLQHVLMDQVDKIALTSGLFAYQFEKQKRVQDLYTWMQQKLEKGNDFDQMQAVWVALREVEHLNIDGAIEKTESLQQALDSYKIIRLNQIWLRPEQAETTPVKENEK